MKKSRFFQKVFIPLILCALLLAGCSDGDWDLTWEFFKVWAEENGLIIDDEIQLDTVAINTAKDSIDNFLNTDGHVQLDGLDVIRDIERAEELSDEALRKQDPDLLELPKEIRPNDWAILEKEAVIWGAAHNTAAAQQSITDSDNILRKNLERGGSCLSARRDQLETRLTITWDEIMRLEGGPGRIETAIELREIHKATRLELQAINHRQFSEFCSRLSH